MWFSSPLPARLRPAVVVGDCDAACRALLEDVLADLGIALDDHVRQAPELALAIVEYDDVAAVTQARGLAGAAPVVAILPMRDGRLARKALGAGADAFHALDTPIGLLQSTVRRLMDGRSRS